ncbi:MAG: hypothetical protein AVDCRST_MAG19-3203 [uncultured Thermomicrobiales bacterium]|uniref:Uncharacterized protein n=1 Tax=uncultured Thermomicrobiales bacterium TaxID=1645740 RepID=A0A6J4VDW3_9BACT|nr:MAG: hypothetical protein AVDCRST_MAG19-3203 [uncultured Thermomicrobiales bacterium]
MEGAGQRPEATGGVLGDGLRGAGGAEGQGVGKDGAQDPEVARVAEAGEVEAVGVGGGAGEVGADLEAVEVADDQQRRVLEGVAVELELAVGGGEVGVVPLVLPGEGAALPDVGPALAAGRLGGALLEGEALAGRVRR